MSADGTTKVSTFMTGVDGQEACAKSPGHGPDVDVQPSETAPLSESETIAVNIAGWPRKTWAGGMMLIEGGMLTGSVY